MSSLLMTISLIATLSTRSVERIDEQTTDFLKKVAFVLPEPHSPSQSVFLVLCLCKCFLQTQKSCSKTQHLEYWPLTFVTKQERRDWRQMIVLAQTTKECVWWNIELSIYRLESPKRMFADSYIRRSSLRTSWKPVVLSLSHVAKLPPRQCLTASLHSTSLAHISEQISINEIIKNIKNDPPPNSVNASFLNYYLHKARHLTSLPGI